MASGAGARQRRSRAFEEGRRRGVPTRRPLLEAPSEDGGFQVQNFGNSSENGNCASKLTLDFEQRIRLRSQQKYKSYSPCKGMSKQISSPDWSQVRQLILDTSTGDMESKTLQEIEKALEVAKSNLESLKMTEEILGHLVTEIKQEEENIADVINNKFEDIAASLNSRKRKLQTELETNTWNYITDVRKVQVCVTQKRRSLDAAIKMARELRAKHSLKTCYNLSQVLSNLKITVEDEVSKVDNLKKRTLPRFYMDSEEIVLVHENIGKLSLEKPNVSHFGDCLLQSSNIEDNLQPTASPVCRKRRQFIEHIGSLVPGQVSDDCLQRSDIWCQEMNPLFIQKCSAGAPWADSTPDVIIEEIIEDNQEMCSAEYSEETHQKKGFKKRLLPFGPKADSVQLVFVSCVINPSHFYVQTLAQKKTAVCLEKTIRQFCRSNSSSPEDILELGTIIFVRSKEHGIWCRAKIIELIPVQNVNEGKPCGPTKYRICDIAKMQVFLIDFGHSEVLIVSGIANEVKANPEPISPDYIVTKDLCLVIKKPDLYMEAQLRGINKLTLQCSLKDIVPKHSSWSGAARTEFLKMINNKAVLMKVFREENGVLVVDLMKPPANKISSDMPVSLRDALVFMDLASFRTELPYQSESTVPLQYCPPVIPQVNTEVTVMVSYVNSPGDFYLQLLEQGPEYAAFLEKVKEVYTNEGGDNLEILYPIQGQPCVARFEDDGEWYRAQVIGLLDHQEVEVKYVDFGNISKINVKDMRKIKDDFLASPAKAIRCKLAYIEPFKGAKEWSIKSKHRLEELTRDKCMLCFVTEKSHDNILTVELYEHGRVLPHQCWNINILLVKEDLASYISSNPKVTNISHCEVWDPAPEEMFSLGSDVLRPENVDLSQIDLRFESNKELQVRISHIVSPSKIFVQFLTSEKYLQSIQKKMIASCYESENETIDWKIDMNCAAYVPDLNEWRRGQIRRIVSENNVEVFFLDFGEIKLMNTVSLRKLGDDLNSIKPLAVECSLTDLRPAGGTDEWTATACDRLVQYLTGTIVNIIVQESNSSPLPVKILSKDGGVNIDISERIIDEGLAFRKRPHKTDPNTQTPENPPEMHLKGENADTSNLSAETEDTQRPSVPEDKSDTCDTECKEQALLISVAPHRMAESYKPPFIPSTDHFSATVSYIADSGTIYVIPKSQEAKLKQLMDDIQNNFKCLGLLEPYCWTKGEACVVRAADTLWHRGQVIEIGGGIIRVQYIDLGYIEKIPQCHLYPTVLYADIPPFSIPCQLYKTIPVGGFWQEDAIELFQELLAKRLVEIHIMEQLDDPWGKLSVKLYFSGMSLSSFMAWHMHCVSEEDDGSIPTLDIANCTVEHLEENCEITYEELLLSEIDTPLLPDYISPSLPVLGAHFPVKVTHVQLPDKVYLALDQSEDSCQNGGIENGGMRLNSDFENLDEALKDCNENIHTYYPLTDFRTDMPCLAQYVDGMWYRGKLCSVKELNPLTILVKFVDYGESKKLTTDRLRQIPSHLMQYPIQAFKVQLAGFKPAVCDTGPERIPYCDKWSIDALWAMVDCLRGKRLFASSVMHSPEHTVFLYGDGQLVHLELVEKGFAELN